MQWKQRQAGEGRVSRAGRPPAGDPSRRGAWRRRGPRLCAALMAAFTWTGCGGETLLADGSPWTWLSLPLVGLVVVEGLVLLSGPGRRGHGGTGARGAVPAPPPAAGSQPPRPRRDRRQTALLWALLLAIAVALAFAFLNWTAPIDPATKLRNVGLWFLGTVLGSAGALLLAWRVHSRPIHDKTVPARDVPQEANQTEIRNA